MNTKSFVRKGASGRFLPGPSVKERVKAKVTLTESGCWIWQGARDPKGYGIMSIKSRSIFAHRASYEAFKERIPAGLVIDHLCRQPACCNPAHLEPVTNRTNMLRGNHPSAVIFRTLQCKNGHPLSGQNLQIYSGRKQCRICHCERSRKWKHKKKIKLAGAIVAALISGCCVMPNAIRLQGEHISHASQHMDGSNGHIGAELVGVVAHWQSGGWFANAEEAYNLSPADGHICNGGLCGNREVFEAAAGYEWRTK